MMTKSPDKGWKVGPAMVVAHGIPCAFPHMFLRVKLRTAWRKVQRLEMRVPSEIVLYPFAFVPFGPIPHDQQRPSRIRRLHMIQKVTGHVARLRGQVQSKFMPRPHVQRAVEMDVFALGGDANGRGLATRRPHPCCRRLEYRLI